MRRCTKSDLNLIWQFAASLRGCRLGLNYELFHLINFPLSSISISVMPQLHLPEKLANDSNIQAKYPELLNKY